MQVAGMIVCPDCAPIKKKELDELVKTFIVTSTPTIEGYKIKKYMGLEGAELVIGAGIFSDMISGAGSRSSKYEGTLRGARLDAVKMLMIRAHEMGGNAVIGVDIDISEFSNSRICIMATGTIVLIEKE
jgi:uncharacterized protein YbjQ (UPF0145 family)